MVQTSKVQARVEALTPTEQSALHRTALGKGDLVPVARIYARVLQGHGLARIVPASLSDRAMRKLSSVEVWCVVTDHGRMVDEVLNNERRRS